MLALALARIEGLEELARVGLLYFPIKVIS